MIERRGPECAAHRAALIDFADRREIGPGTRAALDHLDRCRGCEWEVEATALAITALRRLWAEAQRAEPPADAWSRLRMRLERPRVPVWRWRTSIGGLLVGTGLVAALLAPVGILAPRPAILQEYGFDPEFSAALQLAEQRAESTWLQQQRLVRVVPSVPAEIARPVPFDGSGGVWRGPDGLGVKAMVLGTAPPAGRAD